MARVLFRKVDESRKVDGGASRIQRFNSRKVGQAETLSGETHNRTCYGAIRQVPTTRLVFG